MILQQKCTRVLLLIENTTKIYNMLTATHQRCAIKFNIQPYNVNQTVSSHFSGMNLITLVELTRNFYGGSH